jgi:cyclase
MREALPERETIAPGLPAALACYAVPQDLARQEGMLALCRDLHRLNVLATYRLYEGQEAVQIR